MAENTKTKIGMKARRKGTDDWHDVAMVQLDGLDILYKAEYIEFQDDVIKTTHEQISNDELVELIKQRLGGGK